MDGWTDRQMDSMLLQGDSTSTRQNMPSNKKPIVRYGLSLFHLWVSEVAKTPLHKGALCRLFLNSFITQCIRPTDKRSVFEVS